ncbi:MAG: hypothetical protein JO215_09445 [Ktedonobacteraceae bacterium]|nr:hypothetical protein [Ktedonobacteraceae bacterium]
MDNFSSRNEGVQVQGFPNFPRQKNTSWWFSLRWWYQMTSPPEPDVDAPFEEKELFRRGRTGSQISIFLFLLILVSAPASVAGSNPLLIGILLICLVFLVLGLILNRFAMVNIAGVIVVISTVLGPTVNIVTTPGGINTSALPIFGFLVLPLMVAVSFLPPGWVFVVAAANSCFTFAVLRFLSSVGELRQVLQTGFPGVVTPIILSQLIVSVVAYIWVHGAQQALKRADRAEEIAKLEHDIVMMQGQAVEQKKVLEQDINHITDALVQFSNGNVHARIPLNQVKLLWLIAGTFNNTLGRLNQLQIPAQQSERMIFELQQERQNNASLHRELTQLHAENEHLKQFQASILEKSAQRSNKTSSSNPPR